MSYTVKQWNVSGHYPFFTCSVQAFSGLAVYAEYEKRETGNVTSAAFHEKSEKNFNLDSQVVFYYLIYYYNLFFYVTIRTYGLHKEIYDACPVQKNRVRRNIFAS